MAEQVKDLAPAELAKHAYVLRHNHCGCGTCFCCLCLTEQRRRQLERLEILSATNLYPEPLNPLAGAY